MSRIYIFLNMSKWIVNTYTPQKNKSSSSVTCTTWLHFLPQGNSLGWELLFFEGSGTVKIKLTVCVCDTPPRGQIFSEPTGFLGEEKYFWLPRVGSDVTSVSSSSGLRSGLAPEILWLFPVVLCEVEEVWSQPMMRGGWWRVLCHIPPSKIQWCFSGWQMLLNPPWPRDLWWLNWVTGP